MVLHFSFYTVVMYLDLRDVSYSARIEIPWFSTRCHNTFELFYMKLFEIMMRKQEYFYWSHSLSFLLCFFVNSFRNRSYR